MSTFTRPTFNADDDDDLERLQQEFFANQQKPAAKVIRKGDSSQQQNKRSVFAERLAKEKDTGMPTLEDVEYEPVMDPHPEPHVPVSKKMIDLTSMLGQVLGDITEHTVDKVTPPSLPEEMPNKPARGQKDGFPKPVHRSEFKRRLEAKRNNTKPPRPEAPPQVAASTPVKASSEPLLGSSMYTDENDRRIQEMSEQELEEARAEIMNTLSPESVAILMKGLKKKHTEPVENKKKVTFQEPESSKDEGQELLEMKSKYFSDVPVENEKLAWIDDRFLTNELKEQLQKEKEEDKSQASEIEKVYRKVRFDLQGNIINDNENIPVHKGLHHHGDEPEKAGYTLAELFYLMRSQVPSQRAIVLSTVSRIITKAKHQQSDETWWKILRVFTGKEHAAPIYLRSALDDRHLIALVGAVKALAALVLDLEDDWEETLIAKAVDFNRFLGHIAHPVLPSGSKALERKGLNDKLSELVDRVRQQSGVADEDEKEDDAALAEQDLARALIKMNILPRIRYLIASENKSELIQGDPASVELLVRILVQLAEAGEDICDSIEEEELIEPVVQWGIVKTQWPMTDDGNVFVYPSLAAVRLLTVLAQGSKHIAEEIVERMTSLLPFLVTNPDIACDSLKRRAYALQLETLKLLRVLASYGFIAPILESSQEPVMDWFRVVLDKKQRDTRLQVIRASAAIELLEVLLHAAADPHKTIPEHAIDWPQPTAYLPAITAILKYTQPGPLYESALGYMGAWATYIDLFKPELETVQQSWKTITQEEDAFIFSNSAASGGYTTHHIYRYIQFISAYASLHDHSLYGDLIKEAKERIVSAWDIVKNNSRKDMYGRYALWLWLKQCKKEDMQLSMAELESGIQSLHTGITETWMAQDFLQLCLSTQVVDESMRPFYFQIQTKDLEISKALFRYDGRPVKTLMYPQIEENKCEDSTLEASAFIMSPIDAMYHLDKSKVAQKSKDDAATVVSKTFEIAARLFQEEVHHELAIVTLMKVFLIGDREGREAGVESEREIFWDDRVSKKISDLLDIHCRIKTSLSALENAWRRSSGYIRQAQVPFFQFYQSFIAQYASVSFGHHGFARLLVYLVTQIDVIDYRHLLFSDYHDILSTLKVGVNEVPQLSSVEIEQLSKAGLVLYK
ncbi:RNA polymerase II associated protein 1 [Rhizopus azygosporus]|uniref:RNA polymerase II associated protein 1 n=1 Tax=Rhizopus azygosporus TaxID=86630 RepID=A0A367JE70_RHIAZ|nr:RNA polymerase II associated protein 1 [Rhizopus azygosporus]